MATGYAIFILVSQRTQEVAGPSAAIHFAVVLTVAVAVVAITEWFRDTIRGERPETFRSLSAILTSVLLLAVFEVCVLAYEEVSQATFESPYALQEIGARVSGNEIPYEFLGLSDIPDPRKLTERLLTGYQDLRTGQSSPEASIVYQLGPEMAWTLFPDNAPRRVHDLNAYGGYGVKLWPKSAHLPSRSESHPAGAAYPASDWRDLPPTHESDRSDDFSARLQNLRLEALGYGATGDYRLDSWVMSSESDERTRLNRTRDNVARTLELSIAGSLGFWLSVGLLAAWALRRDGGIAENGRLAAS